MILKFSQQKYGIAQYFWWKGVGRKNSWLLIAEIPRVGGDPVSGMVRALLGKLKQFKIEASSGSTPTIPLRSGPPAASTALDSARLRYTTLCKCMILRQRMFSFDIYPFKLCGRIGRTLKKNNSVQSQFWTVHSKMMMMTTTTTKRSARLLNTVGYTSEVRNTLFISS